MCAHSNQPQKKSVISSTFHILVPGALPGFDKLNQDVFWLSVVVSTLDKETKERTLN